MLTSQLKVMQKKFAYIFVSVICWFAIVVVSPISGALVHKQYDVNSQNLNGKYTHAHISADDANFYNDDASESTNQKRLVARFRVRFLLNRTVQINALLPSGNSIPGLLPAHVKHLFSRFVISKAFLPAYYGFLFRLSPF